MIVRPSSLRWCGALVFLAGALSAHAAIKSEIPELRPPKGQVEQRMPPPQRWPLLVGAACIAGAVALLWPRHRRERPTESAYAVAERELRGLRDPTVDAVPEILRRYMVAALPDASPGLTFEELAMLAAQDARWTPERQERLRRVVDPLEVAKFAPAADPPALAPLVQEALAVLGELETLRTPEVTPAA